MTKVVPRSPETMQAASRAAAVPQEPTPEELAERQERIDYLKNLRGAEAGKKKGGRKWILLAIPLLLLVLGGLAAAYWQLNKKPAAKPQAAVQTQQNTPAPQTPDTTAPAADMKDYTSTNFNLGLSYPGDWTLSDTADSLTITSPSQDLPGADGQMTAGAVVVTIRHKQTSLAEFKTGAAAAVLDSKNVSYTAPATGQRGTTYLSFIQYASTTVKGTLDSVYITGNSGYKKAQAIPEADVVKSDPLVNVHFVQCASGAVCSPTGTSIGVNGESWTAADSYRTDETILKSLSIE
jgi:hypothetical protein